MFDLFVDLVWAPVFHRLAERLGKAGAIIGLVGLVAILIVAAVWYQVARR